MSKNHWSEYWSTGVLTSLPSDFKENYDGDLYEFWEAVLLAQKSPVRILDVCTGNGAVAILLSEIAGKNNVQIEMVAVDASDIKPKTTIKAYPDKEETIDQIQFIGNCFVEDMAATVAGNFDLIVSQYGIEYCDTPQAASSVKQKLKPDGRFVFIAHSPNTAMLEYMKVEQQIFQYLNSLDVFSWFHDFYNNTISANKFKNKLEQALQAMSQQHQFKSHNLFNTWGQTMYRLYQMNNIELKKQKTQIGQFALVHLYAKDRAQDMLDVSQKLINDPKWYEPFITAGLSLKNDGEITYQGKHNVGHFYEFVNL